MWCLVLVLILSHCQLFLVQVTVTGNKYTGSALWLQMTQRVDMQLLNINASMLLLKVTLAHLVTISQRLSHLQVMHLSECYNVNTCMVLVMAIYLELVRGMMAQMLFTCRTVSICLPDGEWCSSLVLGGHVTLCKVWYYISTFRPDALVLILQGESNKASTSTHLIAMHLIICCHQKLHHQRGAKCTDPGIVSEFVCKVLHVLPTPGYYTTHHLANRWKQSCM